MTDKITSTILHLCATRGNLSIADLSSECTMSVPTMTKILGEMMKEKLLEDRGKINSSKGRRPNIFGLNPKYGYFCGIDVSFDGIIIAVMDFNGNFTKILKKQSFILKSSEESCAEMCRLIRKQLSDNKIPYGVIKQFGFALTGRVNHNDGYSFSYFISDGRPIAKVLEENLGVPVIIENDSRAIAYGEYVCIDQRKPLNAIYINVGWGLGMGVIINGQLMFGTSGYAGELGHMPYGDNGFLCRCGKTGCLETEVSGQALVRILETKINSGRCSRLSKIFQEKNKLSLNDIFAAAAKEDMLVIESLGEIGAVMGKALAGLINIFNPESVVICGQLSEGKDYFLLPIMTVVNSQTLKMVNKDTTIRMSELKNSCSKGIALMARDRFINLV